MEFNSFSFLLFFPLVLAVYFVIPGKLRYLWLLAVSYYFYMSWNAAYVLLLLFSTFVTWLGGLLVARFQEGKNDGRAKLILFFVIAANIGLLAYFKYANFLLDTLRGAMERFSLPGYLPVVEVLLPVGISFFTFQAIGFTIDIYRGKMAPERNFLRYALFVSFFPQLVAGPIERASNLLPQLRNVDRLELWDSRRIRRGAVTMLYGYLIKMVIADRAAIAVNMVFANPETWPPAAYAAAIVLFAVQIYCDFNGYSCIAIGAAEIMGIHLMDNFNAPYMSRSIREFWSRWHISLSTWFMDYLYIPLGGNRRGKWRKYLNLLIVFAVSGLWHGAAWHFVIWGLLHAFFRITEEVTGPTRDRIRQNLHIGKDAPGLRAFQTFTTFILVSLAWLFFRAPNLTSALAILRSMIWMPWDFAALISENGSWLGLHPAEMILLLVMILLLFAGDCLRVGKRSFLDWFERRPGLFRAAVFMIGIIAVLMFGVYGPKDSISQFIYFQF